jgi:hypothetical protein
MRLGISVGGTTDSSALSNQIKRYKLRELQQPSTAQDALDLRVSQVLTLHLRESSTLLKTNDSMRNVVRGKERVVIVDGDEFCERIPPR